MKWKWGIFAWSFRLVSRLGRSCGPSWRGGENPSARSGGRAASRDRVAAPSKVSTRCMIRGGAPLRVESSGTSSFFPPPGSMARGSQATLIRPRVAHEPLYLSGPPGSQRCASVAAARQPCAPRTHRQQRAIPHVGAFMAHQLHHLDLAPEVVDRPAGGCGQIIGGHVRQTKRTPTFARDRRHT